MLQALGSMPRGDDLTSASQQPCKVEITTTSILQRKAAQKGPGAMPLWQLTPARLPCLPLTGEEGQVWGWPQQCLLLTAAGLSLTSTGRSCSEEGPSSNAVGNTPLQTMWCPSRSEGLAWMICEQPSN